MIRSMTGFGTASTQVSGAHYVLEIRALNNRYFKAQVRLPDELQGLEPELESDLARRFNRGSFIVVVRFTDQSASAAAQINVSAIEHYLEQVLSVKGINATATRVDISTLLTLPGVMIAEPGENRLKQASTVLMDLLDEASLKLAAMRDHEGAMLHTELHRQCTAIADHLAVVVAHVPTVIDLYQQKPRQRMQSLLAGSGAEVRDEDLLREVAIFAERSDVAEEVARLQGHLGQFTQIIDETDKPSGRTLDFIAQEMLREANTIGSKCLDVDVSRRIVEIKGAIDRIKEQVQNVE